jgi:hypothetical protein
VNLTRGAPPLAITFFVMLISSCALHQMVSGESLKFVQKERKAVLISAMPPAPSVVSGVPVPATPLAWATM